MTEVVLLGQTVNSYHDGTHDFADLLRAVGAVPGIRRLRFTSPHPNDFSDRVLAALADTAAVCEHVHLPMQSGSTRTLRRMLRRYTRDDYLACVDRLRQAVPGLALTTDVIVGFPGETVADFAETLTAVEAVGFDDAYTFRFSPRPGTAATRMPESEMVSDAAAQERLGQLIDTVRRGARGRNLALLGTSQARTRDFKTVLLPADEAVIGRYYVAALTGTTGSTFTGTVVLPTDRRPGRVLPMASDATAALTRVG
jgi:tRNA-2-methylthio-N6-dimethylallyladenosine synthase